MSTKTRRLEARLDPETDEAIAAAAALLRESVSAFVVRSARAEADRVLARGDVTLMPAEQFDAMLEALDATSPEAVEPVPALVRLQARFGPATA